MRNFLTNRVKIAALLGAAAPICMGAFSSAEAAQGILISAGEHGTYSRVVLPANAKNAAITRQGRTVQIALDAQPGDLNLADLMERRKAHRVLRANARQNDDNTVLSLTLSCDCQVLSKNLTNGKIIIDIYDKGGVPATTTSTPVPQAILADAAPSAARATGAPKTITPPQSASAPAKPKSVEPAKPTEQKPKKADAVKSATVSEEDLISVEKAHNRMLDLLRQAAKEGLINIREDAKDKIPLDDEVAQVEGEEFVEDGLSEHLVLPGVKEKKKKVVKKVKPGDCYPELAFKINGEQFEEEPLIAISQVQSELANADYEDQSKLAEELADGFLSIGFGEEALAILIDRGYGRTMRADMARALAETTLPKRGPLLSAIDCKDSHALWQAAAKPAQDAVIHASLSGDAVTKLPKRLQALIATRIARKMVEAGAWDQAQRFFDFAADISEVFSPDLTFVQAQLQAHEGDGDGSRDTLLSIAGKDNEASKDALVALAEQYANGERPHEGFYDDIGAVATTTRGSETSLKAQFLEAVAWANEGELEAAILMLRSLAKKDESYAQKSLEKARELIAYSLRNNKEDEKIIGLSAYLRHRSFVDKPDEDASFRKRVAVTAMDLGLPNVAFKVLHNNPYQGNKDYSLQKAQAALKADVPDRTLSAAAAYADLPEFAELLVKANLQLERNYAALAAATALPQSDKKALLMAQAAWRAGDWQSANRAFAALNPVLIGEKTAIQYALSSYMTGAPKPPAIVEAVLTKENSSALEGVKSMFADQPSGSALNRGQIAAQEARDELQMIKEALRNG